MLIQEYFLGSASTVIDTMGYLPRSLMPRQVRFFLEAEAVDKVMFSCHATSS